MNAKLNVYTASDSFPSNFGHLKGRLYACALFAHSARLMPLAPAYMRQQLKLLETTADPAKLHSLARTCLILSEHQEAGKTLQHTLARLYLHPAYTGSVEYVCRALANDTYLLSVREQHAQLAEDEPQEPAIHLPYPVQDEHKPIPASLVQALVCWPENDKLLQKALQILTRQPALVDLLCRYATTYTPQGKVLQLKPSLLLLGPERSRELVLLSHFETNLTRPEFPLRKPVLMRRQLITQVFHQLLALQPLTPPCRVELITHLLVYDAWHHPGWTAAKSWQPQEPQMPWQIKNWLNTSRPLSSRVATRLCNYWRLPDSVKQLVNIPQRPGSHQATPLEAALALSISAVAWVEARSEEQRSTLTRQLTPWLKQLPQPLSFKRYAELIESAAWDAHYMSYLPVSMRP